MQECFSGCSKARLTFVKNSLVTVIHHLWAQINLYLYSPHVLPIQLKLSTDLHIMPSNHHQSSENWWVDDLFKYRWKENPSYIFHIFHPIYGKSSVQEVPTKIECVMTRWIKITADSHTLPRGVHDSLPVLPTFTARFVGNSVYGICT